jgi:hypothetical protein
MKFDWRHNAQLVAGGHLTNPSTKCLLWSDVAPWDTVNHIFC